ncbi:MAG: N-6 DNA methylase, partial [Gemmatimonadetes bacterium]|nr:N-6 DNA methylase [Gemmatimonadota bacterium]
MFKNYFQGSLFAQDLLDSSIAEFPEWKAYDDHDLAAFESEVQSLFDRFPTDGSPNETQTEDDLIWPVLRLLGWTESLRQQNLSAKGREDVPDGLLFEDATAKDRANRLTQEWKRYEHGRAIVESKRWILPLDRGDDKKAAPSTQMLRYLRRADDLANGKLRWGILTNGARWRLYYAGARSVAEQFYEIDLMQTLDLPNERSHYLKVFALIFGRAAFLPDEDGRTLHQRILDEGRFYEERVATSLSEVVFDQVFPQLADAIFKAAPAASLPEVRNAALTLFYRLLFILYAEDRDLLPVRDAAYDDYSLRRVRDDVGKRKEQGDVFSNTAARYWSAIRDLCRIIDEGDASIGLPPYNGGLFDQGRTSLLSNIQLGDQVVADVIYALSFDTTLESQRYINYRNLSVEQLGSIYERLLERELVQKEDGIDVRLNVFARKGSGSYYTPDALVSLIIKETVGPLVEGRSAEQILDLKICDPAMGSGHFLTSLVDYLSDRVIEAMAAVDASPLAARIKAMRETIMANAEKGGWRIDAERLDDRHIVRRMVLKRCVYGVDKNPMAVELAKVSLWLHTFTAGAPLSFLDHHLRCGDSLFGGWVNKAMDDANALFLQGPISEATHMAEAMQSIEELTDAEIEETDRSAALFADMQAGTQPLADFLSLVHAFTWLNVRDQEDKIALQNFLSSRLGDPVAIAAGTLAPKTDVPDPERFARLFAQARTLMDEERFLNWQVAFPGIWQDWEGPRLRGGFDAVIGNPPWDRIKLQQVEWFAARRPEIAKAQRAADRRKMIDKLKEAGDPLAAEFDQASARAAYAAYMAKASGDYPLLSRGDVNLYSLFVERAMTLVNAQGMVGLLTPSGIASDKTAANFFKGVATEGRLRALYDFENRRTRYKEKPFFPDVDSRFKFCAFIANSTPTEKPAKCAFFLQDVAELNDPKRCFALNAADFARVNPNTGTAPIFRSRRDAELTTAIYSRLPVLSLEGSGSQGWPVKYVRMFDMANDSDLFRKKEELEEQESAFPIGGNRFGSPNGEWMPLYEGKMVQAFDHRAADIAVNEANLFRPGQQESIETSEKQDPDRFPQPRYYVEADSGRWYWPDEWVIAFKDITAATNMRTMISALIPRAGAGHTLPVLPVDDDATDRPTLASLIVANLNAVVFDFVARQKVPTTHFTWYALEQLPVVPLALYESTHFGPKTAAQIIREAVLELTYTAHDMAPFARDLGYAGDPFVWNDDRRLQLRAKLDAVFFHLYGVTDRD